MDEKKGKWYFKTWSLIASFFCFGPFMLPLVWANPRFGKRSKVIISATAIILTYLLTMLLLKSLGSLSSYYQVLLDEKI